MSELPDPHEIVRQALQDAPASLRLDLGAKVAETREHAARRLALRVMAALEQAPKSH